MASGKMNLKGRSFLTLKDYSKEEILFYWICPENSRRRNMERDMIRPSTGVSLRKKYRFDF